MIELLRSHQLYLQDQLTEIKEASANNKKQDLYPCLTKELVVQLHLELQLVLLKLIELQCQHLDLRKPNQQELDDEIKRLTHF